MSQNPRVRRVCVVRDVVFVSAALNTALLVGMGIGLSDLSAQERLGRQGHLGPRQVEALRASILQAGGRVIIGLKPADEARGMRPDGSAALTPDQVHALAETLAPLGVQVTREFHLIPAVAARIDPSRLELLLANPNVDYVEPEQLYRPTRVGGATTLAGVRVHLISDGDTATTKADSSGRYEFRDVPPGTHVVEVAVDDLPRVGKLTTPRRREVTVSEGDSILDLNFGYGTGEVRMHVTVSDTAAAVGKEVHVSLQLLKTEIPLPLAGMVGSITWPNAIAGLVPGSATGPPWGANFLAHEDPLGTLKFAGVSPTGIPADSIAAVSFRVVTQRTGKAEFVPIISQLEVIDPVTGESTNLLGAAVIMTRSATVTVR